MEDDMWKGSIRALMYPIIFAKEPSAEVDRVLEHVADRPGAIWTREELENDVREALRSKEPLADLLAQRHPEPVIRAFLEAVLKKLSPG